jgi:hypothetical protein
MRVPDQRWYHRVADGRTTSMLSPKERARRRFWFGVVALILAIAIYPLVSFLIGPKEADVTKGRATFGASAVAWFALFWGISFLWRSVAAVAALSMIPVRCGGVCNGKPQPTRRHSVAPHKSS